MPFEEQKKNKERTFANTCLLVYYNTYIHFVEIVHFLSFYMDFRIFFT